MRPLVSLAVLSAVFALAADAAAYCRTTTDPVPPNYNPVLSGCISGGVPLAWTTMPVTYELAQAASKQVSLEQAEPVFASAFASWAAAQCPSGDAAAQNPALSFQMLPPTTTPFVPCEAGAGDESCETAEGKGPHQIVFRDDDWAYQDTANTIALTTVSFDVDTGEILAANMEINSHDHQISLTDPPPAGAISLSAIATHEAGHFIGLAHSQETSAVMYAYYDPGMTSLTTDDVNAVCATYPQNAASASSGGCALGVAPRSDGAAALGLAGLGFVGIAARRRRRH